MSARVLGVFATLLFVLQPSPAHSVQFAARQDIATHFQRLTGLAVADFNGDGKLDIAVTDDYSQALVVYPGDGTGKFGSPVTTTLNVPGIGGLGSLVAGDVNEDGKQDLIVAPVAGLQYDVVLFGKGDGTFTQSSQITTSYGFQSASLIDINSDKHLDLIAGGNGSLYVHLGDGKGNFAQQSITSLGDLYLGLTVGDFNGDKNADFVATSFRFNTLVSYLGKGNGTFQAPQNFTTKAIFDPASITSADFNGDGKLDLLVGSADVASLLLGNGDGTFQTGVYLLPIAPVPSSSVAQVGPAVATADLDGDGTADVVAADDGSNKVSVLLNDGTGKFLQQGPDFSAALDAGTGLIQLADLNGDGLPDLVVTNYKTQNVSIFLSILPKRMPSLSVQSSQPQALAGSSVTITVQVSGAPSKVPTGLVTLASGSSSFGQQTLSSTGSATFTLQGLVAGQYPITATYLGDPNYVASTSISLTQAVTDVQVTLPSPTQTVKAGTSATYALNLSALNGFTGTVGISCSGLPPNYSCSPATATLSASTSTVNVIVSPPTTSGTRGATPFEALPARTFCTFACVCLCLFKRGRRHLGGLMSVGFALTCLVGLSGCSGSGTTKTPTYTGTSSFVITVTATQGPQTVSRQVTANLTVQ